MSRTHLAHHELEGVIIIIIIIIIIMIIIIIIIIIRCEQPGVTLTSH